MTETSEPTRGGSRRRRLLRTNVLAGALLVVVGAAAWALSGNLPGAEGPMLGPGSLPRGVAAIVAVLGALIIVGGLFVDDGADTPRFTVRAPLCLLGAVVLFAVVVRPLGLAVAAPAAILVAGLASRESRPVEIVIFAVLMTAFCIALFRYALNLPIPIAPWAGI